MRGMPENIRWIEGLGPVTGVLVNEGVCHGTVEADCIIMPLLRNRENTVLNRRPNSFQFGRVLNLICNGGSDLVVAAHKTSSFFCRHEDFITKCTKDLQLGVIVGQSSMGAGHGCQEAARLLFIRATIATLLPPLAVIVPRPIIASSWPCLDDRTASVFR